MLLHESFNASHRRRAGMAGIEQDQQTAAHGKFEQLALKHIDR